MREQPPATTANTKKVYRMKWSYFILPSAVLSVTYVIILVAAQPDAMVFLIFTGFVVFTLGAILLMGRVGVRLVVSETGIAYHGLGFKVISTWDNVSSVASVNLNGWKTEGLLLRNSGLQISGPLKFYLAVKPAADAITILSGHGYQVRSVNLDDYRNVIPAGFFDGWQYGEIQREVRRYAPQAFIKEPAK